MLRRMLRKVPLLGRLLGGDRPPVSLVMLLKDKPALGAPDILQAVRRALPVEAPSVEFAGAMPPPAWAKGVSTGADAYVLAVGRAAYFVVVAYVPYDADPAATAAGMKRADFAGAYAQHKAWLAVDFAQGDVSDPYAVIGRVAAELMPSSTVMLYLPHESRASFPTPALLEALRTGTWLDKFDQAGSVNLALADASDPELAAAAQEARRRWPEFAAAFQARRGEAHSVKAPFVEGEHVEHMWIAVEEISDTHVTGTLGNDPQYILSLKEGQRVSVPVEQVEDWLYTQRGEMVGGLSVKVLMERE